MNSDRWAKIDRLLDDALERAPSERAAFLAEVCGTDLALRDEVQSLLQAHAQADQNFLQTPALEMAARQAARHLSQGHGVEPDTTLLGRKLGHYQIISVLGVGGMGAVYLARDERLDRNVALKLLPAQFTADAGRIQRFEREARAASALSHPNIIAIYDIGETDSQHFIAAEFVEGKTLRALLERGPLPPREALDLARQIAAALSAAHEAHIIHRDLKPENVMVRKDLLVKVLDFGLARMTKSQPDISALRQTLKGTVLGTVSYMSPEQALGHDVDHRSDLFSLGTTLYELLTGRQAFAGNTAISIADQVIHHTPLPLRQFNQACPAELERIVSRLLEKDRDLRYQTADDLHADLKRLQRSLDSTAPDAATREDLPMKAATTNETRTLTTQSSGALMTSPKRKLAYGFAALAVLAVGLLWWRYGANRSTQPADGFDWRTARFTELTEYPGIKTHAALSPDGQTVVYTRHLNEQFDLIRQRVGGTSMQNLTEGEPADDSQPEFSPQGDLLAFRSERAGGGIFVMGATGESPRLIVDHGHNPSWSPDGEELVYSTQSGTDIFNRAGSSSQLWVVNLKTGAKRQLAAGPDAVQPHWSPHGSRIVFWGLRNGAQRDVFTIPAAGGEPIPLTNDKAMDGNPVWSHDGRFVYFSSNRNGSLSLWRQALDEASGQTQGEPELIPAKSANSVLLTIARNGERMAYTNRIAQSNIRRIAFDAARGTVTGESSWVTQMARRATNQSVAPDGERMTFYTYGDPQFDLYVSRIGSVEAPLQLTNDEAFDRAPRWSPDGERIAYFSNLSGKYEIWTIKPDGSDRQQLTFSQPQQPGYLDPAWSPDGKQMLFSLRQGESFIMDLSRAYDAQQLQTFPALPDAQGQFIAYNWSFDSRMIVGTAWAKQATQPGLIVYDLATRKYEQVTQEGDSPFWLRDGQRLIYPYRGKLYLADRRTKTTKPLLALPDLSLNNPTLSADERFLYFTVDNFQESIWAIHLK